MIIEASVFSANTTGISVTMHTKLIGAMYITTIPVSILGLIVNIIVFWLFCCKIKSTNLTPYFLNLTIANILTSFCSAEGAILYAGNIRLVSSIQHLVQMLHVCAYDTNLYIFSALTAERWVTVYFPVWWQHFRPEYFSTIMCLILWMLSCNLSLLYYFFCFPKFFMTTKEYESQCGTSSIISLLIEVAIVPPSMSFFSLAIWVRTPRPQQKARARLDITIVAITVVILMFTVPTRAAYTLSFWILKIDLTTLNIFTVLLDSSCCIGIGIVYLVVGSWKRLEALRSFHMLLEGALEDTEDTEDVPEIETSETSVVQA